MLMRLFGRYCLALLFSIGVILMSLTSCVDIKKAVYFNNLNRGNIPSSVLVPEAVIQKNDLLKVDITSPTPSAFAVFNASGSEYIVNNDSTIRIPVIGLVKAVGLTKDVLASNIRRILLDRKLLVDPVVNIRFLSFRVTVLGEVNTPKVIEVPTEKISLLDAIVMAGDMTIFARRDNVMVIREGEGSKDVARIDMNSNEIFQSPYYYLKAGDIVYVEPSKAKLTNANTNRSRDLIFGTLSIVALGLTTYGILRN